MRSQLSIHEGAGLLDEALSNSQTQFMYAEKKNVAQILVNKPGTVTSMNLAEVLDQIMECVSTLIFFPSN